VYRIFGLRPQEFGATYEAFLDRVHPDDRAAVDEAYSGSLREGRDTYEVEHRVVRKSDGEIRFVHEKCEHIRDSSGRIVRSIGMVHDITERKQAEEKLKESEEHYRSLFENMLNGYAYCKMIFDNGRPKDFIYLEVNSALEALTGLKNVTGRKVSEVIPGIRESDPELFEIYGRVALTGRPERFERYVAALEMWFSISVYSPQKEYFVAVFDVITERKRAEEALRKAHDELERRVQERTAELERAYGNLKAEVDERKRAEVLIAAGKDLSTALSSTSDLTHALELCLDAAFFISGMDSGGIYLVDRHSGDVDLVVHRNLSDQFLAAVSHYGPDTSNAHLVRACKAVYTTFQELNLLEVKEPFRGLVILPICHEGIAIGCLNLAAPTFDEVTPTVRMALESVALQVGGAIMRIQMEEERKRLAAAVEHAAEAVIVVDASWRIQYVNPAFTAMTGYSREEVIGKDVNLLRPEHADHDVYEAARQRVKTTGTWFGEVVERIKDGSFFPAESFISSLKDSDGNVTGYVMLWRDISKRIELEEQLRDAHKMEAIGTLAGGIAHDFNNMLAVIMGNAEMALDELDEGGPRQNLSQILKASKRSRDLVKQILTFSRRSGGQVKGVHMAPLLKETYSLLRASFPNTIRMDLNVRTKTDMILADPSQVQQVIIKLANNAAYAMREDGGTLTIGLSSITLGSDSLREESMRPGRYVKLTVKDTGSGIAPEVQRHMFEPFFTTKETGQGTGMGLAVVYGIVKGYHGVIEVESEVGKGSKFTILFPEADAFSIETKQEQRQEETSSSSEKKRILFVDDEPSVADMAKTMLERIGYRVTAFTDATEALKVFTGNQYGFDLIITDQTMPDMTGVALAKEVLAMRKDLPIILCTGYSEMVSPEKAKQGGIREFVMKPLTQKEMVHAIRRALEQEENTK
jgi:PAS domain S-box-containing protein